MKQSRRGTLRTSAGIWAIAAALLLAVTPLSASAATGRDRGRGDEHRSARADAALAAAKDLFAPHAGAAASDAPGAPDDRPLRRTTAAPSTADATLVLRDLALSLDDLAPGDRAVARRILARPTDGAKDGWPGVKYGSAPTATTCTTPAADKLDVCLHWVTDPASVDAPPGAQLDGTAPAWVSTNQQVLEEVWHGIIGRLGYSAPLGDLGTRDPGPDQRTDIYLADLGRYGVYGYCVADVTDTSATRAPAYCVLDNDFTEFPGTPLADLKVTAAHEFFHAVQYAYNMNADVWLMEGTAAWVEDELYDSINDNLQYLTRSPLSAPGIPLDYAGVNTLRDPGGVNWRYGSWIWWRFLSEHFGGRAQEDPAVVRQVWQRLGRGARSMTALRGVIADRGQSFPALFADFGAAGRMAPRWYDEGRSYAPFVGRVAGRFTLTRTRPDTRWMVATIDHLSTLQAVLRPGADLRGRWRLRVQLDLPATYRGSQARVIVQRRDGSVRWWRVRLDATGAARFTVPFGRGTVSNVTLSLTNASTRITGCGNGSPFSCGGWSLDDGRKFMLRARAVH